MATDEIIHTCEHPGCDSTDTIRCFLILDPKNDEQWYCPEHAATEGFCCYCGVFSAGIETFDFMHPGICDNCYDQSEADHNQDFEDYHDWMWEEIWDLEG